VLTVSEDMQVILKDVYSGVRPQIIMKGSACGIDLQLYSTNLFSRAKWRQKHNFRDDDLIVIFIGRPERRKGFDIVLNLWVEYFQDSNIKLLLCGPTSENVLNLIGHVPTNVTCLGFVDNIPEVLSCSDILILPSLHEGLSYACIEAQAAGLYIIANDIPGVRCAVKNSFNNSLVKDNHIRKYVDIIQEVNKNRTLLKDFSQQARENAENFSREKFIPQYLLFLKSLITKKT